MEMPGAGDYPDGWLILGVWRGVAWTPEKCPEPRRQAERPPRSGNATSRAEVDKAGIAF